MAIQKRNDELVDILAADFQRRYEANFAWGNACSMLQQLPGLRGFWPMSAVDSSGNAQDQSGHGHVVSYQGNPVYGSWGLAPCIRFDGTGDYLVRTDEADLDITGTETYITSGATTTGAVRGLTLGGWFRPEDNTNTQHLMSKWAAAGNLSYTLVLDGTVANDPVRFYISDDGANSDDVSSTVTTSMNTWQFMAGRFCDADSGEELAVWVNATKTTDTTARASIASAGADFVIAGRSGGADLYTGRAALCFLCAAALTDAMVWALYQQTRALFGV